MKPACVSGFFLLMAGTLAAASHSPWYSAKIGPFVVYSESSAKEVRERAAEVEQFRFSLGELLGRPELTLNPPLELFFYRQIPPGTPEGAIVTRTGAQAVVTAGPLSPEARRTLAQVLLTQNVGRMTPALEHGLESFLSTTELHGAKVVWGTPPSPAERDADWALVEWLVTNGASYGQFRVLLANLEHNVDPDVAFRNAIGKKPEEVKTEVEAFLKAGVFHTVDGPSRPLSATRDFVVRERDADEMNLRLADLLLPDAASRYQDMLNAGAHKTEAQEGLALLDARAGNVKGAAELLKQAMAGGSKNAAALIEYAKIEPDAGKSKAALEQAIAADPNSAEAHFLLGSKLTEPAKQYEQYSIATKLAPREESYWVALANVLMQLKQWAAASKAWRGAEQAATTPEEREKMMSQRLAIEGQRLDDEEAQHRQAEEARQAEIKRLKDQAIAELRAAEAKVNQGSSPDRDAVPWDQINAPTVHADGQMIRIDCVGKTARALVVKTADGKLLKLNVVLKNVSFKNQVTPLACGAQDHTVSVDYVAKENARTGSAGDLSVIDIR
jgi:tetratricopeptide (TPR) repeat protein